MKHAGPQTLAALGPLLSEIRGQPGLVERTPGAFYRRSRAYLHFHEDAAGCVFADIKLDGAAFTRLRVTTAAEQRQLLALVAQAGSSPAPGRLKGSP